MASSKFESGAIWLRLFLLLRSYRTNSNTIVFQLLLFSITDSVDGSLGNFRLDLLSI